MSEEDRTTWTPDPATPDATDLEAARRRDREAPLAEYRDRFHLPDRLYLDGNSLGPISEDAERTLNRAVDQWRDLGIRAWTEADPPWFWYGEALGDETAPLVGAREDEVVVGNSTTVNIHTLIGAFLNQLDDGDDRAILVNELDFPTDHYAIRAQLRNRGLDPDEYLVKVPSRDGHTIATADVIDAMDAHDVGIVFMPSVLYRSGQLFEVAAITEAAHDREILAGFDLAHSVGVVPHDLHDVGVDFAVWCSYKFLNSGPGAIAGLYLHERHHGLLPGLPGWWGHEKETTFELNMTYTPEPNAGAFQIGTIPILSSAPLFGSLALVREAGIDAIREKSVALTEYLVDLVDERLADRGCSVGTPRDPARRGGHVAIEHEHAARISEALRDRGAVVDFRPPNVIRIAPSPLFTRFEDVWTFATELAAVLDERAYEDYEVGGDVT